MSDDAYEYWVDAIGKVYASNEWKQAMADSGLAPLDLQGDEFEAFVADSVASITDLSKQIGLIK
jgi:putative tricarboxylic transport membrane protein